MELPSAARLRRGELTHERGRRPHLLLGVLALLGTTVTVVAIPLTPRNTVPSLLQATGERLGRARERLTLDSRRSLSPESSVLLIDAAAG